jgi:hypothetical protein
MQIIKAATNNDIRTYARGKAVPLWMVGARLGITDTALSKKLRIEMSDAEKAEIRAIVDEIAENGGI